MDLFILLISLLLIAGGDLQHVCFTGAVMTTSPSSPSLTLMKYWEAVLPKTPVPPAISDLITQENDDIGIGSNNLKCVKRLRKIGPNYERVKSEADHEDKHVHIASQVEYGLKEAFESEYEEGPKRLTMSYGAELEEDPDKLTMSYGKDHEEDPEKLTVSYGSESEEDADKITRSYGSKHEEDPEKLKMSYGSKHEEDPDKITMSYGSKHEDDPEKLTMSYGSKHEEDPDKVTMSYWSKHVEDPEKLTMSYGSKHEEDPDKITMSYGSEQEEDPNKITMLYGSKHEDDPEKLTMSYGLKHEEDPDKITRSYGSHNVEEDRDKLTMSYGSEHGNDLKYISTEHGTRMEVTLTGERSHHVHAQSHDSKRNQANVFFFRDMLRPGSLITPTIPPTTSLPALLPRRISSSIPFSTDRIAEILAKFAPVSPAMAREIRWTLDACEHPRTLPGEAAGCATSIESLAEIPASLLGTRNVRAFSAASLPVEAPGTPALRGRYNVTAVRKLSGQSSEMVTCHELKYPYAVYYCHTSNPTAAYAVSLASVEDGAAPATMEALAVCHLDTSQWSPTHPFLELHNVRPGDVAVCHFLGKLSIVWVRAGEQGDDARAAAA